MNNTLFDFEDQPQPQDKPLRDWSGNEIPVSPNPCVRLYGAMEGKQCKDCAHLIQDRYHGSIYYKCELRKHTRGPGSDHRVRWQACKRFVQEQPDKEEEPVKPANLSFTEVCPECKGPIKLLYKHGVWSCSTCKIKITQSREEGITGIESLATFSIESPMERRGSK